MGFSVRGRGDLPEQIRFSSVIERHLCKLRRREFDPLNRNQSAGLAHLGRAFDFQSKGGEVVALIPLKYRNAVTTAKDFGVLSSGVSLDRTQFQDKHGALIQGVFMALQAEGGKGDYRRKEDKQAVNSNWDKIDWSKKSETNKEENSGCSTISENVPVGE